MLPPLLPRHHHAIDDMIMILLPLSAAVADAAMLAAPRLSLLIYG